MGRRCWQRVCVMRGCMGASIVALRLEAPARRAARDTYARAARAVRRPPCQAPVRPSCATKLANRPRRAPAHCSTTDTAPPRRDALQCRMTGSTAGRRNGLIHRRQFRRRERRALKGSPVRASVQPNPGRIPSRQGSSRRRKATDDANAEPVKDRSGVSVPWTASILQEYSARLGQYKRRTRRADRGRLLYDPAPAAKSSVEVSEEGVSDCGDKGSACF